MVPTGNFTDPDWEPTEAEEESVREGFRRTVLFREAMAARGIKILAMKLTPEQEHAAVEKWWREEGSKRPEAALDR